MFAGTGGCHGIAVINTIKKAEENLQRRLTLRIDPAGAEAALLVAGKCECDRRRFTTRFGIGLQKRSEHVLQRRCRRRPCDQLTKHTPFGFLRGATPGTAKGMRGPEDPKVRVYNRGRFLHRIENAGRQRLLPLRSSSSSLFAHCQLQKRVPEIKKRQLGGRLLT
ncbi:hypothetical protein DSCA_13560 [Desulfosarcina alkanivorans]|uniref:Uncharacterized protein n=1 Tax=Desulfosarcina alkanivorans TaxID=571177 RepID=A0A5K7YEI1_9BACT|nr:hypothetical protein DSCA_13560 [Desulfosarcina alkanivorans]